MQIIELINQINILKERYFFKIVYFDTTDVTLLCRLELQNLIFVQVYCNEKKGKISFALIINK